MRREEKEEQEEERRKRRKGGREIMSTTAKIKFTLPRGKDTTQTNSKPTGNKP